jgi:hypothetical protein
MLKKRKSLSQRQRFETFKRDSFTCQYCGSKAPDVVLNVDHIIPVAKGGSNKATNLITSCFQCNSGKSDKLLSDNTVVLKQLKQAKINQERAEQIKMISEWVQGQSSSVEVDECRNLIIKYLDVDLTEHGEKGLKKNLRKHCFTDVSKAIMKVYDEGKYHDQPENTIKLIEKAIAYEKSTPDQRHLMYTFGIMRNRFDNYYRIRNFLYEYANKIYNQGGNLEEIREIAISAECGDHACVLLQDYWYEINPNKTKLEVFP